MKKFIYRVWLGRTREIYSADSNKEFLDMLLGNDDHNGIRIPKEKEDKAISTWTIKYKDRNYGVDIFPTKISPMNSLLAPIEQLPLMMGNSITADSIIKERLKGETNLSTLFRILERS